MDSALVDVLKIAIPSILGFLFGKLITLSSNRNTKRKELEENLIDSIRSTSKDAIEYHLSVCEINERLVSAALIKNQLSQIRTNIKTLFNFRKFDKEIWMNEFLKLQDEITSYPFEALEMPNSPDAERADRITEVSEEIVRLVNDCSRRKV